MQARSVRRFNKDEAQSKLNTVVHTRAAFWKVPYGTRGRVVEIYEVTPGCFDVVVEWDTADRSAHQRDRFAKEPFEEFLAETVHLNPPISDHLVLA